METQKYELKSRPGTLVDVPADYAKEAQSLVDLGKEGSLDAIKNAVSDHECLRNIGILARTTKLSKTSEASSEFLRLQDIVYLRVCVHGTSEMLRGPESEEVMSIGRNLITLISELESDR